MQQKKILNNKGYTLAEVLVVIAIIGIIMGVAVTGIKKVAEGNPTVEAVNIMKNSVTEAKKLAVGRGENVRLVIYTHSSLTGNTDTKTVIGRYLKYVGLAVNNGGSWELVDKGNFLPKEAFFDMGRSVPTGTDGIILEDGNSINCAYYEFNEDGIIGRNASGDIPYIVVNEGRVRRAQNSIDFKTADELDTDVKAYRGFMITRAGLAADLSLEAIASLGTTGG